MIKYGAILFSIIIHLVILQVTFNDHKENILKKNEVAKKIKIKLTQQIVDSEETKEEEKVNKNEKVFLGKKTQAAKKNKTVTKKGKFKPKKKKQLSFKDLALNEGIIPKVNKNKEEKKVSDYTPNTETGDVVEFNTIRYKYYSFFKRIKDKLSDNWRPQYPEFRNQTLTTSVHITIDKKGYITALRINNSSGNQFYDKLAMEALAKSMPFNNPPKDLIASGSFSFEWKFILH